MLFKLLFQLCRNLGALFHTSTLTVLGLWMCRTSAWQFVWINVASSVFAILFPRIIRVECSLSGFYPSLPATSFFLWWKELRDYLLSHGQTNAQKGEQVEELFGRLDLNEAWWDSEFFNPQAYAFIDRRVEGIVSLWILFQYHVPFLWPSSRKPAESCRTGSLPNRSFRKDSMPSLTPNHLKVSLVRQRCWQRQLIDSWRVWERYCELLLPKRTGFASLENVESCS